MAEGVKEEEEEGEGTSSKDVVPGANAGDDAGGEAEVEGDDVEATGGPRNDEKRKLRQKVMMAATGESFGESEGGKAGLAAPGEDANTCEGEDREDTAGVPLMGP